jgi:flagellar hook-basal body complex protein FliE
MTNFMDFMAGQQMANFSNRRAMADADEAIGEWKDFSNRLQGKLRNAEDKLWKAEAKAEIYQAGVACLLKQVTADLARLDPNNPLLRKEVQEQIIGAGMVDKSAALGYNYDSVREMIYW